MFGGLAKRYFRRRPGRYPTYRTKGLKRYAPRRRYGMRKYKGRRAPQNRVVSTIFRSYNFVADIENNVISTVGQAVANHIAPSLSDMPGCAPWINLFAQYRINKLKIQFIPMVGKLTETADITSTTEIKGERPLFATTINRVSTSFPQDLEQIMTTGSVKYHPAGRYHQRYYTPSCFETIYRPGITATEALSPAFKQWISTNMINVPHHGLSYVMGAANNIPTGLYKYKVIVTMYCQFKNKRVNTDNVDNADGDDL